MNYKYIIIVLMLFEAVFEPGPAVSVAKKGDQAHANAEYAKGQHPQCTAAANQKNPGSQKERCQRVKKHPQSWYKDQVADPVRILAEQVDVPLCPLMINSQQAKAQDEQRNSARPGQPAGGNCPNHTNNG